MSAEDGIRRAILLYPQAHDIYDTEGLVQVWAEDGVFITTNGQYYGHQSIREFHEGRRARAVPEIQNRLLAADPLFTVNGSTAEAFTSVIGLRRTGEEPWSVAFFVQRLQLGPLHTWVDANRVPVLGEAAVDAANHVLSADHRRKVLDAPGNQFGMFDHVRLM